jgi:hypothetical protein
MLSTETNPEIRLEGVIILKGNQIVLSDVFRGRITTLPHHSPITKSVSSILAGIALDQDKVLWTILFPVPFQNLKPTGQGNHPFLSVTFQ